MARLVLGINVRPRGATVGPPPLRYRPMRLVIRSRPGVYGDNHGYAYVLGGSREETDPSALPLPGPTLVLAKGEPVAVTIVNRSHEAAAVHWHGIELESFPDGVPGWSGAGDRLLPAIAAGDSFTVHFTPPRAGTFMYHSHMNEAQQISSGLYGAIVVLEPGERFDSETDHILLFSDPGPAPPVTTGRPPPRNARLNGEIQADPIVLRAGVSNRLRVINIRSNALVGLELLDGREVLAWRHVAKDGADLPTSQAVTRPAFLVIPVGEIYDVVLPPRDAGTLTLRFGFPQALRPPPRPPAVPFPAPTAVTIHIK
jgi:FtsP/CotA-like multicopper oxidase with cupredoxin domain